MSVDGNEPEQLLRQFQAAISGMELDDLRRLASDLPLLAGRVPHRPARPRLRRPPRDDTAIYRMRVDLDHARPPIWRRLDVRSDATLDVLHQVLQAAFDWTDSHLHRFALGGGPFEAHSELFLCPYDVEEGEDDGSPASGVRLDETLQEPGDVLRYVYDYGDSWELTLRLEQVLPAEEGATIASCVDGRRAAPPEDCGGITDADELAAVLDDPAHVDIDEVNRALRGPYLALRDFGVHPQLVDIVNRLRFTDVGDDLAARLATLGTPVPEPTPDEMAAALRAHLWFLDRAADGGIELTSAGYLKPADVEEASQLAPAMGDWIGKNNREVNAAPLLDFRQSLQAMGLLRKYKGKLLLTRAGSAVRGRPERLWEHLAARLAPAGAGTFAHEASLLILAYAATSPQAPLPRDSIVAALDDLGWRRPDGRPLQPYDLRGIEHSPYDVLVNVSSGPRAFSERDELGPVAAALARAALLSPES
jgi:Plasmid pRiA4b ORF-3-like protein